MLCEDEFNRPDFEELLKKIEQYYKSGVISIGSNISLDRSAIKIEN